MGKKTKKPKAPNYAGVAEKQTELNKQAWQEGIQANRSNQIGPTGSSTWSKDPESGQWTQSQQFNHEYQGLHDSMRGLAENNLAGFDSSQIDLGQAPGMPTVGGYNQQAIDTMRALQAPGLQRQREAKEAQLAAMGLGTGSGQAWNSEQQNLGETANNADLQAIMAGINQGNVEFGQGMDLHQQGVQDILNQKAGNHEQLQGLFGLATNPKLQFDNPASVGAYNPGDLMGAAKDQYGASLDKTNAQNADKANNTSALGKVAGLGASFF